MDSMKQDGAADADSPARVISNSVGGDAPAENANEASTKATGSTTFEFEHRVFQSPGAVFRKDRSNGSVALHLMLGGVAASIDMNQLTKTFLIGKDTPDGRTLRLVEKGLSFVREIRPGDSIPNELLDGRASWTIERRHYDRARSKIIVQLVKWMTEGNSAIDAGVDVLKLIETPEVKSRITDAFGAAARQLGIKEVDTAMVPTMIGHLTGELAQIEALREKIAGYAIIRRKLKALATVYRNDARISDTIDRISLLITQPFNALRRQFQLIEAQTAEIMSSLRQLTATVQFLRGVRDELREFVLLWDDLDAAWLELEVQRSDRTDALIARTYRFAATHYSLTQNWTLNAT